MKPLSWFLVICWTLSIVLVQLGYERLSLWHSPSGWRIASGMLITLLQAAAGIAGGYAGRPKSSQGSQIGYWLLLLILSGVVSLLTFGWSVMLLGVLALFVSPAFGLGVVGTTSYLLHKWKG